MTYIHLDDTHLTTYCTSVRSFSLCSRKIILEQFIAPNIFHRTSNYGRFVGVDTLDNVTNCLLSKDVSYCIALQDIVLVNSIFVLVRRDISMLVKWNVVSFYRISIRYNIVTPTDIASPPCCFPNSFSSRTKSLLCRNSRSAERYK